MADDQQREALRQQVVEAQRRHRIAETLAYHKIPISDIQFNLGSTKLVHIPSGEFFSFGNGKIADSSIQMAHCSRMAQGGESHFASPTSFDDVSPGFYRWCESLKGYIAMIAQYQHAPDPFELAARSFTGTELAKAGAALPNDSLTALELARVRAQISVLMKYVIENGNVQGEKMSLLEGKMDYLTEASERLGKKDLSNILIATLINIIISGLFAPDRAQELMDFGAALFAFLFQPYLIQ